jgi:hypothetical protein
LHLKCATFDRRFIAENGKLLADWLALPKHRSEETTIEPTQQVSCAAAV